MKRRNLIIIIMAVSMLIASGIGISLYRLSPKYVLNQYITNINNKNYKAVYPLFYKDNTLEGFSEAYVINYIERYFNENNFIKIEKTKQVHTVSKKAQNKETYYYPVRYLFGQESIDLVVGVSRHEDQWKVLFPFKMQQLKVYAPAGATVYVGQNKISVSGQEDYVECNLLPSKYNVKIEYPAGTQETYQQIIDFPKEQVVFSPYNDYTIEVKAPLYTKVEIAGITKENTEGSVKFANIIEGEYTLSVYDPYGTREAYNATIQVGHQSTQFKVGSMPLSQQGYNKISQFTSGFYQDYIQGINNQKSDFLNAYVGGDTLEEVTKEYESWFIDDKDIQDATVSVQVEQVQLQENAETKVTILEVIQMLNQEEDGLAEYQLVLKWENTLRMNEKDCKITERILVESLVSYKDEQGKWVQY